MLRSLLTFLSLLTILPGCTSHYETQPTLFLGDTMQCVSQLTDFYHQIEATRTYPLPYVQDERFPFLAFDRFSTSLSQSLNDTRSKEQWIRYVGKLGDTQLENALKLHPAKTSNAALLRECQANLTTQSAKNAAFWMSIIEQPPKVSTDYQHWKRVLGAYPLASFVAEGRIKEEQAHIQSTFHRPLKQEYRYGDTPSSHVDTNAILASALQQSTLNWPLLSESQEVALLRHFAPVVSVETLSRDDLPGRLTFNHYNDAILDTTQPTIYQGVTYTRFQGNVLVQLNYVLWFAARTAKTAFDPYAGKFDAINLRLTLDHSGQPFIFDSIHQCGCFHMVYALSPTLSFSSDEGERPISVTLPQPDENDRLHVSLSAGEHMITQVEFTDNIQPQLPVSTLSWQQVSTVPITNGEYRSPFDREGILTESARGERWFLWPFGVRSPGAMRQQGKHAIAFIGERHFDDALLFEELLLVE